MAKTKASKTTKGSRKSQPKYLGVKLYGGEVVDKGMILVRQRGSHIHEGKGVKRGRDFTLYAVEKGVIHFYERKNKSFVSVIKSS